MQASRVKAATAKTGEERDRHVELLDWLLSLTSNEERCSDQNNGEVPERPEVSLIEHQTCILNFPELIITKGEDPDVQEDFEDVDMSGIAFDQDCIVEDEERQKEGDLKGLLILRHS